MCSSTALYSRLAQIIPAKFVSSLLHYHKHYITATTAAPSTTSRPHRRRNKNYNNYNTYYPTNPSFQKHSLTTAAREVPLTTASANNSNNSSLKNAIFTLSPGSEQKGVSVTPVLGILYVCDQDLLQSAMTIASQQGSGDTLIIDVLRRLKTEDRNATMTELGEEFEIILQWSNVDSPCADKVRVGLGHEIKSLIPVIFHLYDLI